MAGAVDKLEQGGQVSTPYSYDVVAAARSYGAPEHGRTRLSTSALLAWALEQVERIEEQLSEQMYQAKRCASNAKVVNRMMELLAKYPNGIAPETESDAGKRDAQYADLMGGLQGIRDGYKADTEEFKLANSICLDPTFLNGGDKIVNAAEMKTMMTKLDNMQKENDSNAKKNGLEVQAWMNERGEIYSQVSNMLAALHDSIKSAIGNLRG